MATTAKPKTTKKAAPKKAVAKKVAPKKTVAKKAPAKKAPVKKAAPKKVTPKKVTNGIKSLRIAPDESQSFLLISSDFDGKNRKFLQLVMSLILLAIFGVMIYMAVLTNQIAQAVLLYG